MAKKTASKSSEGAPSQLSKSASSSPASAGSAGVVDSLPPAVCTRPRNLPEKAKPLHTAYWLMESTPYDTLLDVRETFWAETLLGIQPSKLHDLAGIFLRGNDVYADEKDSWGPPKWNYNKADLFDSFDFYIRHGCPNCGTKFETDYVIDLVATQRPFAALMCKSCGHRPCPAHFDIESESIIDRLAQPLVNPQQSSPGAGAVYLRGTRRVHDFGQNGKEWWQSYYLPRGFRGAGASAILSASDLLGGAKGEIVKEVCEVCGHGEAFFATFQARSADEGLTILYECTQCHSRKTFNN